MLKMIARQIPQVAGLVRSREIPIVDRVISDRKRITGGNPKRLENYGFKIYSQSDEDGIIAEIFRRIGTTNGSFIDFGAQMGTENNTRLLLEQGWTGLWIEGHPGLAGALRSRFRMQIGAGRLKFVEQYVDRDNINDTIATGGMRGQVDFLSIDIDGNDYHVFEAIDIIHPRVVCLEHNPDHPPPISWIMPYDPEYRWDQKSSHYGASLCALRELAERKGYELIGCGLYSPNGFYVRSDLAARHFQKITPERAFNPLNLDMVYNFPVGRDIWRRRWV